MNIIDIAASLFLYFNMCVGEWGSLGVCWECLGGGLGVRNYFVITKPRVYLYYYSVLYLYRKKIYPPRHQVAER